MARMIGWRLPPVKGRQAGRSGADAVGPAPTSPAGQGRPRRGHGGGPAGRCGSEPGGGSRTARRRRGRRSGPLTRLPGSTLSGRDRRTPRPIRGKAAGAPHAFPARHPTAEPCLTARAGVRGLAPGCGTGHGGARPRRLIRLPARGPCPRRCAGTARGARPGRGARLRGRSPRRRRRRASRGRRRA